MDQTAARLNRPSAPQPTCATTTSCCARTGAPACRTSAAPAHVATPARAASCPAATPPTTRAAWTATAHRGLPRAPPPCSAACCCWGWLPAWTAEPRGGHPGQGEGQSARPVAPCAPRPESRGAPGAGVRGLAVRRVRPELLPGATQQSPPAPSPLPQWHLPPPLHGSGGCCGVLAPAACDFGLSFSFILPTAPFLFFLPAVRPRVGRNAAHPTPSDSASCHTHDCCRHPQRLSLAHHQPADPKSSCLQL